MNSSEDISQLPLGWARSPQTTAALTPVALPYSSLAWFPEAEVPHGVPFDAIYQEHLSRLSHGFVLQNCSVQLRDYLLERGCQAAAMGAEAVLQLPWRGKRSVRELARRGRRHGAIRELAHTPANQYTLNQFVTDSARGQAPQLKHTARPTFDGTTRCFVLEEAANHWLGAITISMVTPTYAHVERLLRRQQAPVGVMEAIITEIANTLVGEGVTELSLGNIFPPVPELDPVFEEHRHSAELWRMSQLAFTLGRASKFAFNYEGLWRFKEKFSPTWRPLYLCATPRLSWATILGITQSIGYFSLAHHRTIGRFTWDRYPDIEILTPKNLNQNAPRQLTKNV